MSSNDSTAKEQSFLFNVNKIFLVIHLLMLFMFSSLGVDLMAGVSLISICFYFLAFSLTKSEKLSIYVYSVAVEILLHMILAVVCLGIQCNFQLHADLLLAGITQLVTVIVADKIHQYKYIRSLKPLIA